jgi:hypothetical protein
MWGALPWRGDAPHFFLTWRLSSGATRFQRDRVQQELLSRIVTAGLEWSFDDGLQRCLALATLEIPVPLQQA